MAENTTTPMKTLVVDGKSYEIVDANARQNKQDTLVSGTNIKTINGSSILGSGNVEIGGNVDDVTVNGTSVVTNKVAQITTPTKTSDLTNDSNFQDATQVDTAINSKIASVYKAKGSVAFSNLPALTSSNEGFVYDINESFTTTSDFVEGAGATYPAGTNVVIIDVGSGVYKYDVLTGLVDLSGKQDLLVSGTNIKTINNESILGSGNLSIPTGDVNVQSDWNQTDTTADDYIKNKPASMPASDVFAWAKAATKPTYTAIEVGAQETLVSGTNIKTINNTSLLGSGNITLSASDIGAVPTTRTINSKALSTDITLSASDVGAQATLVSGTNIKTINGSSILGSGNLTIDCGTPLTIVLDKDDWVSKVQSVAVSGMDAEKNVFVGPTLASSEDYAAAGILCTAQGAGSLTFTCETVPTTDLSVNLLIL